jgi:uncharacterized membrane protein
VESIGSTVTPGAGARAYRLASIDMLRGLVMVIMALDHVRDYVMATPGLDPMADPNIGAGLFFTRWITHICAPVFVFLAGTSAGLMAGRRTPAALGAFLLSRGVWLIAIELAIVSTAWTFAPFGIAQIGGAILVPLQVIWAIGASMIVLAGAQFLGQRACLVLGAVILVGHNLLDPIWPVTAGALDTAHPVWVALHAQMSAVAGPLFFVFVYPVPAWAGVMLLGYGTARVFQQPPARRDARLLAWGIAATAAFVVLRLLDAYGDPNPWQTQRDGIQTTIDFLNTTKYPPSLIYLLMTLGPAAMLCAVADRAPAAVRAPLIVFGRAPLAFYVAHLYLVHALAAGLGVVQGFDARQFLSLFVFFPQGYGVGLGGVYVAWLLVVVALYPLCRWVSAVKDRRRDWWLSYF